MTIEYLIEYLMEYPETCKRFELTGVELFELIEEARFRYERDIVEEEDERCVRILIPKSVHKH